MHNAPSVTYPVGRSRFAGLLMLSLWLLGSAAAALWLRDVPLGWRTAAMVAALVISGACAARQWLLSPIGTLAWDGESWRWAGERAGAPAVALDLQHAMLLHWRKPGASHWLWVVRADHAARWNDLRRAVYSRARPSASQPAEPGAAKP